MRSLLDTAETESSRSFPEPLSLKPSPGCGIEGRGVNEEGIIFVSRLLSGVRSRKRIEGHDSAKVILSTGPRFVVKEDHTY